jgi:hypothetical protein
MFITAFPNAIHLPMPAEEFQSQKFGLELVVKFFFFGMYSGEANGPVLAMCVTFVSFWSIHVLLRDRDIFLLYNEALSSWIYFVSNNFHS